MKDIKNEVIVEGTEKTKFVDKVKNKVKEINMKRVGIGTAIGLVILMTGYALGRKAIDEGYIYEFDDTLVDGIDDFVETIGTDE